MIIEERVERSQYVKLITWIVSFIILMAGIVFPVLILWVKSGYDVKGYWCLRFMS